MPVVRLHIRPFAVRADREPPGLGAGSLAECSLAKLPAEEDDDGSVVGDRPAEEGPQPRLLGVFVDGVRSWPVA